MLTTPQQRKTIAFLKTLHLKNTQSRNRLTDVEQTGGCQVKRGGGRDVLGVQG